MIGGVHPACLWIHHLRQLVRISGLELGQAAMFEDKARKRVPLLGQLLEHGLGGGRCTLRRLLEDRKLQLLEQDRSQLLGRVDVERVARMSMDAVLFMGQNFDFIRLPDELTTGSSIMPHKKNPDVLELLRAKCNRLSMVAPEVSAVTGNLISGYHRDYQVLKEILHPALQELKTCLGMMHFVVEQMEVNPNIQKDERYQYIYSVEAVNEKVQEGIPFRDAYREVASEISKGRYRPGRDHTYTHLGSIGNPGLKEIKAKLDKAHGGFHFVRSGDLAIQLATYFRKS